MNKHINHFLQAGSLIIGLLGATLGHADVGSMSKVYSKPQSAPQVQRCKGNNKCNAFYALAKEWQSIPNNFKLDGINVKSYAKDGDGYGLWKGFTLNSNRAIALANAGDAVFFKGGSSSKADERIYAQGMAVLLYLENKSAR
ncbi:hypothetical protein [uncultured Acinetobacter sp.]|uniref:hypothetical protein n=1 Tax=uncultured Acinetobacter sp. TaxID=165433 RepID=UPI002585E625|nr:hypothetical protein [uncultured Acinetobacter sp.]